MKLNDSFTDLNRGSSTDSPDAHSDSVQMEEMPDSAVDEDYVDDGEVPRMVYLGESAMNDNFNGNKVSTGKYNLLTLFPKFLFEQFSQYANLFFLFISMIQQIPGVSPTGRFTTIMPLSIVLLASLIKELLEDKKRHSADNEVNSRPCKVFREGTFQTIRWTQIKVGDVVKVLDRQFFPADLVLLASSEPQGMCYVETASLDGETNLKIKQALPQTTEITSTREVRGLAGRVVCEQPNNRLYKFVGNIHFTSSNNPSEQSLPLSADQMLLRGAQLRNTPWIYGCVVYTGHESKLMQNQSAAPSKRSNVDNTMNSQILGLFVVLLVLAVITTIGNEIWFQRNKDTVWYLGFHLSPRISPVNNFLTNIILYNMLIPISLIVTLDMVKYCQASMFINSDLDMYDEESDTPARALCSTLNEELGQVQYIFSDKTGTLTRNIMEFLKCSIGGIAYGDVVAQNEMGVTEGFQDPALLDNLTSGHPTASVIREWLTLLAVCHTVVPERDREDPDKINYQAASPDEEALVKAVKMLGFSFNARTPTSVIINALGKEEEYQVLNVLEFNSTRKRMSVIVRSPSGLIKLYCKGADNVIYDRLSTGRQPFAAATEQHLKRFAGDGLRTLCLGVAQLTEEDYQAWSKIYHAASTAIVARAEKIDQAAELIEKNLLLLGASAIEDKLQADVPRTISKLADAGIKIWVLTGDKQETAINIGFSCQLLRHSMKLMVCNENSVQAVKAWIEKQNEENGFDRITFTEEVDTMALIIDGASLTHALSEEIAPAWLKLARRCKAVICCRVSPLQKADIVRLVRKSVKAITLAIGDGANDVGMIQAAHVGVGISGQEGLQAARAADYAIGQFRFLQKLLLCHGNWSYRRISLLILYFFYKNASLMLIELYFAMENAYSGQVLYEKWMIAAFNVFFTLFPPLAIGIFDQHLTKETLLAIPQLYRTGQRGKLFNTRTFWTWAGNAWFHCTLAYYLVFQAFKTCIAGKDGHTQGQWYIGSIVYAVVVYTVTFKAALVSNYWTVWLHVALWGSLGVWTLFTVVYFNMWKGGAFGNMAAEVYGVSGMMYGTPAYWAVIFSIPVISLFRDFTWEAFRFNFLPGPNDVLRKAELLKGTSLAQLLAPMRGLEEAGGATQDTNEHRGFAFSQAEHQNSSNVVSQTELIRRYNTVSVEKPDGN